MEDVIIAIIYIGSIFLVYRDSRKAKRSIVWTVGSIFIPIILPIIYFVKARKGKDETVSVKKEKSNIVPKHLYANVAGTMYKNDDGTYRPDILSNCEEGDPLELVREPNNKHDNNAVAIHSEYGQIGYLYREEAMEIAPLLDAGSHGEATIIYIKKKTDGFIECHIEVLID